METEECKESTSTLLPILRNNATSLVSQEKIKYNA